MNSKLCSHLCIHDIINFVMTWNTKLSINKRIDDASHLKWVSKNRHKSTQETSSSLSQRYSLSALSFCCTKASLWKNVFNQEIYLVRPKKNYGERVSHLFAVGTTAEKSHKEKSWSFSCAMNFSCFSFMLFRKKWFFSREQSFVSLSFIFLQYFLRFTVFDLFSDFLLDKQ